MVDDVAEIIIDNNKKGNPDAQRLFYEAKKLGIPIKWG